MVHRFWTSTVSNRRTDRRRGAEPPTGADFTFCTHEIICVTNIILHSKYHKRKTKALWTSSIKYTTGLLFTYRISQILCRNRKLSFLHNGLLPIPHFLAGGPLTKMQRAVRPDLGSIQSRSHPGVNLIPVE